MTRGSVVGVLAVIDDDTLARDDLRERTKRVAPAVELAHRDRNQFDALRVEVAKSIPERNEIEVVFFRVVREHSEQGPGHWSASPHLSLGCRRARSAPDEVHRRCVE